MEEIIMKDLYKEINILFSRRWDDDLSEAQEDEYDDKAKALISDYGWDDVYKAFNIYLRDKCSTANQVMNAANIFWDLGWYENPIQNPYEFMSYFYYRINFDTEKYDPSDILDSLATTILPKNGVKEADLFENPYYMPEKDPKMIEAVHLLKQHLSS